MSQPVRPTLPPAWLFAALLFAALIALSPVGYLGGGGDDWYYVEAARCAAERGPCLPQTHWGARMPLVAPMGAAFALLGIGQGAAALVPLGYALAAAMLFAANVEWRFGRGAAWLASVAFIATPAMSLHALQPLVDLPELAWTLAALLAAQVSVERRDRRAAALAGAAFALAVMTRMSALALVPILGLGWLKLPAGRRGLVLPFATAFAAVLGGEAAVYWAVTGDPRYGWLLSLHHTRIPTTELPPDTNLAHGALFNLDLIRGWRRSMDIHVHWTIDPLLNLIADPHCGLTLIGAAALVLVRWRDWRSDAALRRLTGAAALHFAILTYGLAVDPKPRMFLFDYAVAAVLIGVLGLRAWRGGGRAIAVVLIALLVSRCGVMIADRVDPRPVEAVAARWIAEKHGELAVDDWTRRTFALLPAAYALPVASPAGQVLVLTQTSCGAAAAARGSGWRVARAQIFTHREPSVLTWLRARGILLGARAEPALCLLSRR